MNRILPLWRHFRSDKLFQNSIYLMLATGVMAVFGFVFWIFGAKLFSPEQIGLASSLLSVSGIVTSLSLLGFNNSIIRYLPGSSSPLKIYRSATTLVGLVCILFSLIALHLLNVFTPALDFVANNFYLAALFVLFTLLTALNLVFENMFIALRTADKIFYKNILYSVIKLIAPFFLVSFAAFGLFGAIGISTAFACLFSMYYLARRGLVFGVSIYPEVIRPMFKFSLGNYIVSVLNGFPTLLLPILITSNLGPTASGYFYIDFLIIGLLFVISSATSNSFLAEGSQKNSTIRPIIISTIKITYALLVPSVLVVIVFGPFALSLLGKNYASEGILLLRILSLSSIFVAANSLCGMLLNLQQKIERLITVNFLGVLFILGSVLYGIQFGLVGVGIGFLVGQALITVTYAISVFPTLLQLSRHHKTSEGI